MDKKIILVGIAFLIILFVVFNSGTTNINGLDFNIPNGFKEINHDILDNGESYKYQDSDRFITITVIDTPDITLDDLGSGKISTAYGYYASTENKIINGKEGIVDLTSSGSHSTTTFTYVDNGKTVEIKLSGTFPDDLETTLSEIIK